MARNPVSVNCIPFATTPVIPSKDGTLACQWAKLNKKVIEECDSNGQTIYFVAGGN